MGESREKRTSYALGMNNGYGGVKLAKLKVARNAK